MKKRRILSALLAAIMLSAMTGCGSTVEETTAAPTDDTAAETVETSFPAFLTAAPNAARWLCGLFAQTTGRKTAKGILTL